MSDGQQANGEHLREIAKKLRRLARQTQLPEARKELFDLADRLERMAEGAKATGGSLPGQACPDAE